MIENIVGQNIRAQNRCLSRRQPRVTNTLVFPNRYSCSSMALALINFSVATLASTNPLGSWVGARIVYLLARLVRKIQPLERRGLGIVKVFRG